MNNKNLILICIITLVTNFSIAGELPNGIFKGIRLVGYTIGLEPILGEPCMMKIKDDKMTTSFSEEIVFEMYKKEIPEYPIEMRTYFFGFSNGKIASISLDDSGKIKKFEANDPKDTSLPKHKICINVKQEVTNN